jgi:DNA-binding CsgD family transcriptional regulator/DNA-binding beta-propeller fold protein YncE
VPPNLSRREHEVARLVAEGLTSREIGQKLFISERTAEGHIDKIRSKLGVRSRAEIAGWVARGESINPTTAPTLAPVPPATARRRTNIYRPSPGAKTIFAAGGALASVAIVIVLLATVVFPRVTVAPVVQPIRTFAGTGDAFFSSDGKTPLTTELIRPSGVVVDGKNSFIYFVDGNRIRRVGLSGLIETIAGNGNAGASPDGIAANEAKLQLGFIFANNPLYDTAETEGLAISGDGNLFFPDTFNDRVREVAAGKLVAVAGGGAPPGHIFISGIGFSVGDGGLAAASILTSPRACAFDPEGNLYIADTIDNRIRRVDHVSGIITTVAGIGTPGFSGDGQPAVKAELNGPEGVIVGLDGKTLYIADTGNQRIRRVDADGVITTDAGTGEEGYGGDGGDGRRALFDVPLGLALDSGGNLYIADSGNNRVRKLDLARVITTVAGTGSRGFAGDGGAAAQAELAAPVALAVDAADNLFIADFLNNRIRVVALRQGG